MAWPRLSAYWMFVGRMLMHPRSVADWFAIPDTQSLLDFVRPDFLLLRVGIDVIVRIY